MRRYKEGFDRLGIVAFVFCAALFWLVYLMIDAPFRLPEPGSDADQALTAELAEQCGSYENALEARICQYRVTSPYRWRHYRDNTAAPTFAIIVAAALALAGGVFGRRIYRWVRSGFDRP